MLVRYPPTCSFFPFVLQRTSLMSGPFGVWLKVSSSCCHTRRSRGPYFIGGRSCQIPSDSVHGGASITDAIVRALAAAASRPDDAVLAVLHRLVPRTEPGPLDQSGRAGGEALAADSR